MISRCKKIVLFLSLLALMVSCRNEMEQQAPMRLSLCLPIQESIKPSTRRIMGDPGTREMFEMPKYVYIFIMKQVGTGWQVWKYEERTLTDEDWVATRYSGSWLNRGDSIYKYDQPIQFMLQNEKPQGRVYAVCSNKKMTFNVPTASITSLDDLLDLKFNCSPDSIQENLQNIYTTPYNYTKTDGDYYCSFDCSTGRSASVDLLLYHIASKVDLKWNVEEDKRIDKDTPANGVRLTYMETRNLFNGFAYCFKPMRNTLSALPSSGYTITNIVTPSDEGLWWEGRTYFYTIPYTVTGEPDYFPLQLVMCTNDTPKENGYKLTLKQPIDTSDVFVPWLRGNFNLTKPLENKSETKIAGI